MPVPTRLIVAFALLAALLFLAIGYFVVMIPRWRRQKLRRRGVKSTYKRQRPRSS